MVHYFKDIELVLVFGDSSNEIETGISLEYQFEILILQKIGESAGPANDQSAAVLHHLIPLLGGEGSEELAQSDFTMSTNQKQEQYHFQIL